MRRTLALLALLVPLAAAAEPEVPVDAAPPGDDSAGDDRAGTAEASTAASTAEASTAASTAEASTTTTTTTTSPDGTTTTTTTTAPGAGPSLVVDEDPCGTHRYARWRHRMKGRISIGFSKSHLELEDDAEGTQKSFVARLHGRRGWSLELELSKLTLDGGDSARTAGASVVKTFGRRKIAPYLLAGGGGGKYETVDGVEQRMKFGEVGAGVMLRGKRFSIGVDMRRGVRKFRDADEAADVMRSSIPGGDQDEDAHDHYTRGRVLALINF